MATVSPELQETRARLKAHFTPNSNADSTNSNSKGGPDDPSRWEALWAQGFMPWDRGLPNPALIDLLFPTPDNSHREHLDTALPTAQQSKRKRALVPGCGKGYDVLLLASFGYDATGLEVSESALKACRLEEEQHRDDGKYAVRDESVGKGTPKFVNGNFFEDGWVGDGEKFDLIYDYTFLSALSPASRPQWAQRMSDLLSPTGRLICLEFPSTKDPSTGGPPFALPAIVYEQHLSRPGEEVPYAADGRISDVVEEDLVKANKSSLVRVDHFMPERTHEIGKGQDWISIWKHR